MKNARHFLATAEVERFHRDGFLIPAFRFSEADVTILSRDVSRIVDLHPDKRNEPIVTAHLPNRDRQGQEFSLMPFCRREEVLDMIQSIDGPDLMLWTTTVFARPARDGIATPWHQDGEFWPIEPMAGTSAWVAATPSTRANGCVRVVPGSHLRPRRHRLVTGSMFILQVDPSEFDEADAVDVELEAGQMMLFDSRLIHGSWPNTSDTPREGFVMRYIPTTSFFDHERPSPNGGPPAYADRALFLVRGTDRCGRNDFVRNH
ncbi:MAG: phytanoyl-CoA dioxygenase family protein [Gammaproteobacteria bacterium]